uniref:Uncharacterized protein n=1 Tax=Arundo donax TaxID=35708 RepID=A0A0A9A2Q3_ARUDO
MSLGMNFIRVVIDKPKQLIVQLELNLAHHVQWCCLFNFLC